MLLYGVGVMAVSTTWLSICLYPRASHRVAECCVLAPTGHCPPSTIKGLRNDSRQQLNTVNVSSSRADSITVLVVLYNLSWTWSLPHYAPTLSYIFAVNAPAWVSSLVETPLYY